MDSSQIFKFYIGGQAESRKPLQNKIAKTSIYTSNDQHSKDARPSNNKSGEARGMDGALGARIGHIRDNHQNDGRTISIEKRMPINIFNIRNVNYLKTESRESSQIIFENEIIKQSRSQDRRRGGTTSKHKPSRTVKWTEKSVDRIRSKTFYQTHNTFHEKSGFEDNSKKRKKSIDSKSLLQLMSKANQVKNSQGGAKLLFQKIVKDVEKNEGKKDRQNIEMLISHLNNLKNRHCNPKKYSFFLKTEKTDEKHNTTMKSDITESDAQDWEFTSKTNQLTKDVSVLISDFKSITATRQSKQRTAMACQTADYFPKPIHQGNFNTPNLIKEFSRAFMLHKGSVNPGSETGSQFMARVTDGNKMADCQLAAVYRDIFSLEQEHLLVEESLKMIQEKGFDIESIFMAAYDKLHISGSHQKSATQVQDDIDARDNVSAVSFESHHMSDGIYPRDTNCYMLDFDMLDRTTE